MTIQEVYEKYEFMDRILSGPTFQMEHPILYDLWQAIKAEVET